MALMKKETYFEMKALHEQFHATAVEIAKSVKVDPMYVQCGNGEIEKVDDGFCGFSWITIKPASSKFGKFLLQTHLAEKYGSEVEMWVGFFNQSYTRKVAYAKAYVAQVLEHADELGVTLAKPGFRLD